MLKKQNGITLIALIITIIVMLILVGVTINVALNGGLFTKADTAVKQTQLEMEKEILQNIALGFLENNGEINFAELEAEYTGKTAEGYTIVNEGEYATATKEEKVFYITKHGGISEEKPAEKEGNQVIIQGINNYLSGKITEEIVVQLLKQELMIEDENINDIDNLVESYKEKNESSESYYIYIKEIDEMYIAILSTDDISTSYADEETHKQKYNLFRGIEIMREELDRIFTGTTQAEMSQKYNEGTLDDYVLDNSEIITAIDISNFGISGFRMNYVTIYEGENEATLSGDEHAYHIDIEYENGNYSHIDIGPRNLIYINLCHFTGNMCHTKLANLSLKYFLQVKGV